MILKTFAIFFISAKVWAAACCGGAAQIPALITAEDRTQFTSSFSQQNISDEVRPDGYWYPKLKDLITTFKLNLARKTSDKDQLGFSIPIVSRQTNYERAENLGDIAINYGHKFFEEGVPSNYQHQVVGFLGLTLPTGKNKYQSNSRSSVDVVGGGFYQPSFGFVATRSVTDVDTQIVFEVHKGLARKFNSDAGSLEVNPLGGYSVTLATGYNIERYRAGISLISNYDAPKESYDGGQTLQSNIEKVMTAAFSFTYLMPELQSVTVSYADQRLFGDPTNTTLGQTLGLSLQKRWPLE